MTPTQEALRTSTKLISMTEAAFWAAVDAAEERGKRMALEAAAKVADDKDTGEHSEWGDGYDCACRSISDAIRQIDPAALKGAE